jgi:hypothetical protein
MHDRVLIVVYTGDGVASPKIAVVKGGFRLNKFFQGDS